MKTVCIILLSLALFLEISSAKNTTQKSRSSVYKKSEYLKKLIKTDESKINLAKIAFELSKEVEPRVNVSNDLKKIKMLANEVKKQANGATDPQLRIAALHKVLFKDMELRYDFSDPTAKKAENNLLSHTLRTGKGSCVTMPLLYLAISQEMGWPIYPVIVQNHMFLRYTVPGGKEINIEATSGSSMPDNWYIKRFEVSASAIRNGNYMRTISYKELVGVLLQFNTQYYFENRNLNKAFDYVETALNLFPRNPNLVMLKASMFRDEWKRHQEKNLWDIADLFWTEAKSLADLARSMGFKNHDDTEYLKTMKMYENQEIARKQPKSML